MSETPAWAQTLSEAEQACRSSLAQPALNDITTRMSGHLEDPERCFAALAEVSDTPTSSASLQAIARNLSVEPHRFEQWILLQTALAAFPKIKGLPVFDGVKTLWADEVMFVVRAPSAWLPSAFSLGHVRFSELARILTLRRFPAGQFHWELSGLPRSYVLRTAWQKWPALLACLQNTGGFKPLAESHLNARRRNRLTITESEGTRSYYLLARSLEKQPHVRGLLAISWLYSRSTGQVSPQLAWLPEFFERNGAFLGSVGPAPTDSGFMIGSEERRKLYAEGKYRPELAYAVWPRREMLSWADRYEKNFTEQL